MTEGIQQHFITIQINMNTSEWCTIESDPAVFTELVSKLGVENVQVEELYSLEDTHQLEQLSPIYGLIFLFKWTKDTHPRETLQLYDNDLFFARQVVKDACATQAIVSVLLNSPVKISGALKEFQDFSRELTSEDKGLALGNSEDIRRIHNEFKQPQGFIISDEEKKKRKTKEGEAFHFISYVPFKGNVYQLDGIRKGPINLGNTEGDDWISVAKGAIEDRIKNYEGKELRFTLLVVCENQKKKIQTKLDESKRTSLGHLLKMQSLGYKGDALSHKSQLAEEFPDVQASAGEETEANLLAEVQRLNNEIALYQMQLNEEQEKITHQKNQNARRKHNYLPFILQMLKIAAKKGKIQEFLASKEKKQQA